MAWQAELADRCPSCGTQSYEQDLFEPGTQTCRACMRLEMFKADFHDTHPPKKPGKSIVLRRADGE